MKYRKGTFLVVPNRHELNGKPPEMQVLHFWLCSFANEEGSCFPSRTTLEKCCGFKSLRTVDKYMEMLVEGKFITKKKRPGKEGKKALPNLYQVHVLNAPVGANDDILVGAPNSTVTISNITISKEVLEDVPNGTLPPSKPKEEKPPFLFKEEFEKLGNSTWKVNKIIYNYWKVKGFEFENKKQFDSAVKREIRPAKLLEGYTAVQINKTMDYCKDNYTTIPWTLETCVKRISDVINKKL